jgi:hypothetical protein
MNSVNSNSCTRPGKNWMSYMKKWKKFLDGVVLAAPEANMSDVLLDGHVRW